MQEWRRQLSRLIRLIHQHMFVLVALQQFSIDQEPKLRVHDLMLCQSSVTSQHLQHNRPSMHHLTHPIQSQKLQHSRSHALGHCSSSTVSAGLHGTAHVHAACFGLHAAVQQHHAQVAVWSNHRRFAHQVYPSCMQGLSMRLSLLTPLVLPLIGQLTAT